MGWKDYQSGRQWIYVSWEREVSFRVAADGNILAVCDSTAIQIYGWEKDTYILASQINVSETRSLSLAKSAPRLVVISSGKGVDIYSAQLTNLFKNETGWLRYKLAVSDVDFASISKDGSKVACLIPVGVDVPVTTIGNIVRIYQKVGSKEE